MKNGQGSRARPGYGPRSSPGRSGSTLSRARLALLETLRAQAEPTTLAALATLSGLHLNTVREHLDGLVTQGLARRHTAAPQGRGRPAWLYQAIGRDAAASPEYAGLAAALPASISRTSDSPEEDAARAGTDWGRDLARQRDAAPVTSGVAARREVVSLFDEIGFAPEADARSRRVRLTRCPLLEAAHQHPDVVCAVHLGIARGALEEYGADPAGTELVPFAEPGACRLHLMGGPGAGS